MDDEERKYARSVLDAWGFKVRDPARINRILEKLRRYWHSKPDLRLGQIVVNLTPPEFVHIGGADPFNVEDDRFEEALDAELQKFKDRQT